MRLRGVATRRQRRRAAYVCLLKVSNHAHALDLDSAEDELHIHTTGESKCI